MDNAPTPDNNARQSTNPDKPEVSADMVAKVTEKVLEMLLLDLKVERERYRLVSRAAKSPGGWK